ncbi:hypothetical protein Tco_0630302, partial [Tanacetum coccineum]
FLLLEEANAFIAIDDEPISWEIDATYYDPEGDVLILEALPSLGNSLISRVLIQSFVLTKSLWKRTTNQQFRVKDGSWVSPIYCVPKKGGITVVKNDDNDLIPTQLVTGWIVCIDYRKLNEATRKDHFPLPFMDQMLERLAGNQYYCFLDGFSGIEVDRAKVEVIAKLPHPTTVKGVRSFLGHAGFYQRFIQDFSKIARPMTHLLEKETPFFFSEECIESYDNSKKINEAQS